MDESDETRELRLGNRHLAFFFVGAVAVCAIFFALGFVVGRGQAYEAATKEDAFTDELAEDNTVQDLAAGSNRPLDHSKEQVRGKGSVSRQTGAVSDTPDYRGELDFYSAVKEKSVDENFHPSSKETRPSSPAAQGSSGSSSTSVTKVTRTSEELVTLQVAAFRSASEADSLVKALRSKGYSVFIVGPAKADADKFIRVQIGPFFSAEEAAKVKARLEKEGYEAITKR